MQQTFLIYKLSCTRDLMMMMMILLLFSVPYRPSKSLQRLRYNVTSTDNYMANYSVSRRQKGEKEEEMRKGRNIKENKQYGCEHCITNTHTPMYLYVFVHVLHFFPPPPSSLSRKGLGVRVPCIRVAGRSHHAVLPTKCGRSVTHASTLATWRLATRKDEIMHPYVLFE